MLLEHDQERTQSGKYQNHFSKKSLLDQPDDFYTHQKTH